MRHLHRAGILLSTFLLSPHALAAADVADNFRLTDHQGVSHELYYLSDMKAVVLLAQGNGCDASRQAASAVQALQGKYESQGVTFLAINSNLNDSLHTVDQGSDAGRHQAAHPARRRAAGRRIAEPHQQRRSAGPEYQGLEDRLSR